MSTNEKRYNFQLSKSLRQYDLCNYEIMGGLTTENPQKDEYIIMTVISLNMIVADMVISENIDSNYVDVCSMEQGDVFFARHPYKMFLTT